MVDAPAPVEVQNADPIDVTVIEPRKRHEPNVLTGQARANDAALILKVEDQRRISGMWESTQRLIALSVVWATLLVSVVKSLQAAIFQDVDPTEAGVAFVFLASVANLVIGFYFGRTNHQRVGGDTTPGVSEGR